MTRRIAKTAGCATLLFICLTTPTVLVVAQRGGKAEGRQVRFERGKTSATYSGEVSGSVEVEYEFKAEKGQELIVRVVSDQSGSASVKVQGANGEELQIGCLAASRQVSKQLGLTSEATCFESDPQKLKRSGQTWSASLLDSGAYTLSVFKPTADSGVSPYTLTIIIRPLDKETGSAVRTDSASLDVAMRKFVAALMKRDVRGFLSLFSRTGSFFASNPLNAMRTAVSYSELAADLRKKGDWYFSYLERGEGGSYDAFVDNLDGGKMWRRVDGSRFVPPGTESSNSNYVRWRREGGKWVIAEISYPQA